MKSVAIKKMMADRRALNRRDRCGLESCKKKLRHMGIQCRCEIVYVVAELDYRCRAFVAQAASGVLFPGSAPSIGTQKSTTAPLTTKTLPVRTCPPR